VWDITNKQGEVNLIHSACGPSSNLYKYTLIKIALHKKLVFVEHDVFFFQACPAREQRVVVYNIITSSTTEKNWFGGRSCLREREEKICLQLPVFKKGELIHFC